MLNFRKMRSFLIHLYGLIRHLQQPQQFTYVIVTRMAYGRKVLSELAEVAFYQNVTEVPSIFKN
ncbi:unnamed protein product [Hymenolepis diminuta]|uniref:Uncharacterized protein n=1 Tax=Hymenolepis diminuta TaxID=6216 RepID=A0A564Y6K2_HYMDI|nr:unnamed protein product [Hymenolepis diminuta]